MTTTQHPLTKTAAAELWDTYPHLNYWDAWPRSGKADLLALLRAVFDLGREHARPAEVTTEAIRREVEYAVRTAAAHGYSKGKWGGDRSESIQALITSASAVLSAALAVATPADPLHDHRPWDPLAPGDPLVQRFLPCTPGASITGVVLLDRGHYVLYPEAYLGADGAWHVPGISLVLDPALLIAFIVANDDVTVRYQLVRAADGVHEWRATYRPVEGGAR